MTKKNLLNFFGGTRFVILHLVNDIQKESQWSHYIQEKSESQELG